MKDARFQMIDSDAVGDGDGDDDDDDGDDDDDDDDDHDGDGGGGGGGLEQKSLPPSLSLNQLLSTQVGMGFVKMGESG